MKYAVFMSTVIFSYIVYFKSVIHNDLIDLCPGSKLNSDITMVSRGSWWCPQLSLISFWPKNLELGLWGCLCPQFLEWGYWGCLCPQFVK